MRGKGKGKGIGGHISIFVPCGLPTTIITSIHHGYLEVSLTLTHCMLLLR